MRTVCCALLLLVTSLSLSPAIAEVVPGRGLGARPPTPVEQTYIDAVYTQTTDVAPNRLARAREDLERRAAAQRGELLPAADGLPSAVDNSTLQYFPPIRSQGSQGSCTCFASCYYYNTFTQAFDEGYDVSGGDDNHICSPAFLYPLINDGYDWGASTQYAMGRLNDLGSSSWALKPYSASDWTSWPSEAAWVQALNNRTQEPHWIDGSTASGLDEIKQHLANGNLAVTDFWVYGTWYDYYPTDMPGIDSDVYYAPDGDVLGGHAVTIVGYDDNRSYVDHRDGATHYGAFLAANSWGTWWGVPNSTGVGDAGFFWVAYDMFLEGTFGPWVYYNDDRPDYRPRLYAVVGVNHPERWDLRLRGSVGEWHSHDVIYYAGGDIAVADDKRIAVDLTDGIPHLPGDGTGLLSADLYVWSGSYYDATLTSADFFADLDEDGSYDEHTSADPTLTIQQGQWGSAYASLGHSFSVTAAEPDPSAVASRGVADLSAEYVDSQGHGVAQWEWSDGGAGGLFAPSRYVQSPSYTAPPNDGYSDIIVTLTVTATCDGEEALVSSDSTTLTVLASRVRFEDIGTTLNLPSTTGVAWGDYNNDGYPDLYMGARWGEHRCVLLRNEGDGTFTDVTVAMGLRTDSSDWEDAGIAWGDYNNDGLVDLIVSGGNHDVFLYRNDGSTFTEVGGAAAGMPYFPTSRGVAWGDYDGDNWLDVFVGYEQSNISRLYRNNRDGTFTMVNNEAGMEFTPAGLAAQCSWIDHNNDGLLDLSVARIKQATGAASQPRLYTNNGDGTFTDLALASGITGGSAMGLTWGDYDNDGFFDLFLGGNLNGATRLYHNNGDGSFTDVHGDAMSGISANTHGVAWADYDNDGFLDLAQGNGVSPPYNESGPSDPFLFHNNRDGTLTQVAASEGITAQRRYRGIGWADFNLDGHIDLLMAAGEGYSCLYENSGPPTDGNWLRVRALTSATGDATDGSPVRDALGARVDLNLDNDPTFPPGRTLARTIDGGSSWMSQNEQIAHFGVGSATTVAARVAFPDGSIVTETDIAVNQQIVVRDETHWLGAVEGVVTEYVSGEPVPGALVTCAYLTAITDFDGSYYIDRVPVVADMVVRAWSPEYEYRTIVGVSVSALTTVDLGLVPAGYGVIQGIVTDAQTTDPIEGATVSCGEPVTTNAAGEYVFYVAAGSGYLVSAGAPGYTTQKIAVPSVAPGEIVLLDIELDTVQYGSIGGVVTDADSGSPVGGTMVRACRVPDPATQVEVCYEATSAGDGTYLISDVPAASGYTVTASADGYYSSSEEEVSVTADTLAEIDLALASEFEDVPAGYWAFESVGACVEAGVVAGYADGSYHPEYDVTRDQMAVYISRALAGGDSGVPEFTGSPSFPDVPEGHWALKYIEYAVSAGVVAGYGDGTYHPDYSVDRGQMAVYIARGIAGGDDNVPSFSGEPTFPDVPVGFWAVDYVEYIADPRRAVTQGYPDGLYHPEIVVTRDQMAVYVARAFGLTG